MTRDDSPTPPTSEDVEVTARTEPVQRKKLGRLTLAIIAAAGLGLLASPLWGPPVLRHSAFFKVRRVEIVGVRYLAPSDILGWLHVDTTASVWDPTAPLTSRIERHPAIQNAVIHRKLPGTLVVDVTERVPVALVPAADGFRVYDAHGVQLPIDLTRVSVDAPVLALRDVPLLRLLGSMKSGLPSLYARVNTVRRVAPGELLLELKDEPVRVMEDVTLDRLADLEPVEKDLHRRQVRVAEIDLRYRDQVIARLQ